MTKEDTDEPADDSPIETDGGTATEAAQHHQRTSYLDSEVNMLQPSTPFMRDHLRVIRNGFIIWVIIVFGPVTLTAIAPGVMTTQLPVIGFPLHYFLVAIGAPTGALLLAVWYARKRDQLDEKYGIDHPTVGGAGGGGGGEETATADGGVTE